MKIRGQLTYRQTLDALRKVADQRKISLPELIKQAIVDAKKFKPHRITILTIELDKATYEYEALA